MIGSLRTAAMAGALLFALFSGETASAQKTGGILKMFTVDSPASMSIHEEATIIAERPMMGVFNNLVMFDQHARQSSLGTIVLDLATGWSWNEDGTDVPVAPRGPVARRQAVHGQGCQMYLGHAGRKCERE